MPSNAPPSPFPFLPVVLESPAAARARKLPATDGAACLPEKVARRPARGTSDASRGKARATCRSSAGKMQTVPGLSLDDSAAAFRAEIERRIDPAGVTLLGAIIR